VQSLSFYISTRYEFCTFVVRFPFHMISFHVEVFLVWFYDESLGCGMRAYGKAKSKAWPGRSGREVVFDHSI
jgi:hypothetical protein